MKNLLIMLAFALFSCEETPLEPKACYSCHTVFTKQGVGTTNTVVEKCGLTKDEAREVEEGATYEIRNEHGVYMERMTTKCHKKL